MNICVITPLYPVEGRNDIKTDTQAIHLLLKYLSKEHDIHVFNINRISPRDLLTSLLKRGNNLNYLYNYSIDDIEATLLRYRAYPKQRYLTNKQIRAVQKTVRNVLTEKKFVPDVIVVHLPTSFPGLLDGIYQNVRKIAVLHRTDINVISFSPTLIESINAQYHVITARSKSVSDMAKALGAKIDKRIVYSGIPSAFLSKDYEHNFNKLSRELNVLYVGKLIERKHPEYMLSLCEDLNSRGISTNVTVIGSGPMSEELFSRVRKMKYGNKVNMISSIPRSQVQEKMRSSDVFVLPSVNETLGLVYLEAMAAGCITIGVENEGIDGIINNSQNGFLVKPEDYQSLLDCILSIIDLTEEEIKAISRAATHTANACPEEKASENYLGILQSGKEAKDD